MKNDRQIKLREEIQELNQKRQAKDIGKYKEAFRRLLMLRSFQDWVLEIRRKAGIPEKGMEFKSSDNPDEDEWAEWIVTKDKDIRTKDKIIDRAAEKFCKEHILNGFDQTYMWQTAIHDYILTGYATVDDYAYGCEFVNKDAPENELKKLNHTCVGLFIFPYAKQKDVIRYIKNNWELLHMFNWNNPWNEHYIDTGKNPRTGKVIKKINPISKVDFYKLGQIGPTSLYSMRQKKKANEHERIYQLYKAGYINSYGISNPKKASNLMELGIKSSPDNVRKIIYTHKKLHNE